MGDAISYTILGLVQGATEFLPVSSSGHLILAREFLGITQNGLAADAVLQLATALAVVAYFWNDLWRLAEVFFAKISGKDVSSEDWNTVLALIVGTVPGVLLGLLLEHTMDTVFRDSHLVAYALIAGSLVMLTAEYVYSRISGDDGKKNVDLAGGLVVGIFQALALVPGMSRSGMTISGGLFLGLSRAAAARFGFLLAVPIILGSGAKKFFELSGSGELASLGMPLLWGSAVAFVSGFIAIHFLLGFLRNNKLTAFVWYRIALAAVILFFF
jgi:undecaprenyl-diphosphatase